MTATGRRRTSRSAIGSEASTTTSAGAPVSILVNNAGINLKKPAKDTSPAEFNSVLQTHVVAAHALSAAALPGMT